MPLYQIHQPAPALGYFHERRVNTSSRRCLVTSTALLIQLYTAPRLTHTQSQSATADEPALSSTIRRTALPRPCPCPCPLRRTIRINLGLTCSGEGLFRVSIHPPNARATRGVRRMYCMLNFRMPARCGPPHTHTPVLYVCMYVQYVEYVHTYIFYSLVLFPPCHTMFVSFPVHRRRRRVHVAHTHTYLRFCVCIVLCRGHTADRGHTISISIPYDCLSRIVVSLNAHPWS